jgi:acyl carrier protein
LHTLTQNLALDFFAGFSSMTALLGSPGQGNYAAANAFMDGLMRYRRNLGLPGLSINWRPWAEQGMAARLSDSQRQRLAAQGLHFITPEQGLRMLEYALGQRRPQICVFPVEWPRFGQQAGAISLVSEWLDAQESPSGRKTPEPPRLWPVAASADERQKQLRDYVRAEVAAVLGLEAAQLPASETGFAEMGLDSLMAVELRKRLSQGLGVSLPATLAFEYPTVHKLAAYLGQQVLGWATFDGQEPAQAGAEQAQTMAAIEQLSAEQVETSIAEQLAKLEDLLE